ncbi:hypothetical protein [Geoalkalibacter sp.]|jgi:hypothetical protein|uniref:hypothetical protein n=1 Tax=Geoalkalibacter sp. TaxID=3041440 RepID=UPI00272E8F5F|nr:hypothetical protein [Geoalkalibacter sp.]
MPRALLLMICFSFVLTGCGTHLSRSVAPSQGDESSQVRKSVDELFASFQARDLDRFSSQVSRLYFNDKQRLELRVRRDFNAHQDVRFNYTLTEISPDGLGRVFVTLNYDRTHFSLAEGQQVRKSGQASFIFYREENHYRLVYQRPPLFGLH